MAPVELVRNVNVEGVPTYVDGTPLESWPSQPYLHFSREGKNHLINPNYGKWPLKPFNAFFVVRLDTVLKDSCFTVISSSESYGSSTALGVTKDGTFGMFYGGDIEISVGSKCKVDPHKWYIVSFTSTGIIPDKPSISFSVRTNGVTDSNLVIEGASAAPYLMVGATGKHEATDAFNGDIAEIIMFSRILSVEEWTQTARYLESKYRYMLEENNTFTGR